MLKGVVMPPPARKDGLDKFARYRASQKQRGMKRVRLRVHGAPEEREAPDFIDSVADFSE